MHHATSLLFEAYIAITMSTIYNISVYLVVFQTSSNINQAWAVRPAHLSCQTAHFMAILHEISNFFRTCGHRKFRMAVFY